MQVVILKTVVMGTYYHLEGWKVARDLLQEGQYLLVEFLNQHCS